MVTLAEHRVFVVYALQLQSFRNLLEEAKDDNSTHKIGFNWRPTQPLNGRVIYSSFSQPSLEAPPPTNRASKTAFDAVNWITLAMIAMSNF
jgi:Eukaryotic-type carbonic anhydrase